MPWVLISLTYVPVLFFPSNGFYQHKVSIVSFMLARMVIISCKLTKQVVIQKDDSRRLSRRRRVCIRLLLCKFNISLRNMQEILNAPGKEMLNYGSMITAVECVKGLRNRWPRLFRANPLLPELRLSALWLRGRQRPCRGRAPIRLCVHCRVRGFHIYR